MTYLALLVVIEADVVKVFKDLESVAVLLDLAINIETDHVGRVQTCSELEHLLHCSVLDDFLAFASQDQGEVDGCVSVILLVLLLRAVRNDNIRIGI